MAGFRKNKKNRINNLSYGLKTIYFTFKHHIFFLTNKSHMEIITRTLNTKQSITKQYVTREMMQSSKHHTTVTRKSQKGKHDREDLNSRQTKN